MNAAADATPTWWVICLCADWCGVCREWRAAFDEAAAAHPTMRFAWVDVEDEDDAMGDVDIETFPTLLIARDTTPLFFGPLQPSGAQFARLLSSLTQPASAPGAVSASAAPLLKRLAEGVLPR
ncbi:thioredoxin [Caenimonas koreensis DSM 17982]|uniref:Thioredoxin n=1 Tax=Caenimonas koreensis DSM 17982 TaxID=1121255 RepID=A0A844BD75_9BURK|nr:thioredoxin family protein [Caenimonas koreensis]MRD49407.1 thioredoxin [Caenimonas koreensis DSM 17982]